MNKIINNDKIIIQKRPRLALIFSIGGLSILLMLFSFMTFKLVRGDFRKKTEITDPKSKIISAPSGENENTNIAGDTGVLGILKEGSETSRTINPLQPTISMPISNYVPYGSSTSTSGTTNSSQPTSGGGYDPTYCTNLWNARTVALAPTKAKITETQNKIYNLMDDIRRRTSGSLVTEPQIQAMYAQEKAVLDSQLNVLNNELNNIKAQYPVC